MSEKSVSSIIKDNLCTGCGTCVSLCPHDAIELRIDSKKGIYIPNIDLEVCNDCGICRRACPGGEVDFNALNIELFGKKPDDNLLGNYINCYTGYSTDESIRYNSSSGGLVTTLLIFALEEGIIDGALVTRMKKDKPLEPEPFIARTREEIIEASKSKYCPVPANIALKKILESSDGERFAVVGLPCHIHGIRKAQIYNKTLRERITLCIGLLCAHTDNFHASKFVLSRWSVNYLDVKTIEYRGSGWPGSMVIELNDGTIKKIPFKDYINIFHSYNFFTPRRCLTCGDATGELADISFGDAWDLPIAKKGSNGFSIVMSRSKKGDKLLREMEEKKKISIEITDKKNVITSQRGLIYTKKIGLRTRKRTLELIGEKVPDFETYSTESHSLIPFTSILPYFNSILCLNKFGRKVLRIVPYKILFYYGSIPNGMAYLWIRSWSSKE